MTRSGIVRISGAALIALSAAAMFAVGTASAHGREDTPPPPSGDDRAVSHSGNATTCEQAGLAGTKVSVTAFTDDSNINITVTAVPDGVTLTGVVVKGGPAYNVYLPDKLGPLPWEGLHSPINSSGKPAGISHWFACGVMGGPTTAPPTETPSPTEMPTETTAPPTEMPTETTAPPTDMPTETTAPPTEMPTETTAPPTCDNGDMSGGNGSDCDTDTPPPCDNGDMSGGSGSDCETSSPSPSPSPSVAQVSDANLPNSGGNLAHTGFNTGLSLTLAGVLLLLGVLMVAAPGRLALVVGRLRRRS